MTKIKEYIIQLVLLFLLNSCMSLNDDWIDLGNDYKFHQDGKSKSIYPSQTYFNTHIYSEVTDYGFDEYYILAKQKPDIEHYKMFVQSDYSFRYTIYSNFVKDSTSKAFYEATTPFIRQSIEADSSLYKLLKSKGVTDKNQIEDQNKIQVVLDSVFQADPFYVRLFSSKENYWIIDKNKNVRFGPLTKDEFERECKLKNIRIKLTGKG